MKTIIYAALTALILTSSSGLSANQQVDEIEVRDARAYPNAGANGAVYLTISNKGENTAELISATSPVSGRVELHEHLHEDGVMRMRRVNGGVKISSGKAVKFKPAGLHIMLFNMREKFKPGDSFPLSLKFKSGATKTISVSVIKR